MSDSKWEMMKEAFLIVKEQRDTYRIYKQQNRPADMVNDAFMAYMGASDLFKRLFKIDFHDANEIFKDPELWGCPF